MSQPGRPVVLIADKLAPSTVEALGDGVEVRWVDGPDRPALLAPLAWLGDAIAIKDPTAAIFRRQGGANMLIAGQREDLGTSLLAMSIVSLAAEHDPHPGGGLGRAARFVLLEPAIAEAEAMFDHPLKQYALFKEFADDSGHVVRVEVGGGIGTTVAGEPDGEAGEHPECVAEHQIQNRDSRSHAQRGVEIIGDKHRNDQRQQPRNRKDK